MSSQHEPLGTGHWLFRRGEETIAFGYDDRNDFTLNLQPSTLNPFPHARI